jgi:hypothetical protein
MKTVLNRSELADNILSLLNERDVALWLDRSISEAELPLVNLPWKLVLSESITSTAKQALLDFPDTSNSLVRKRGYSYLVETDPTKIELPQRSLPIFVLGTSDGGNPTSFESRFKRMAMLDQLRRSGVKALVVVSDQAAPPKDLEELWGAGYRSYINFVSSNEGAAAALDTWLTRIDQNVISLISVDVATLTTDLVERYSHKYSEDRDVVLVRDARGTIRHHDITGADDPDRPVTEFYELLRERDVAGLVPEDLSEKEFQEFFSDPLKSWRPYAAGLPWMRSKEPRKKLMSILRRLDELGSNENCVAYIASESGAGGTTLSRFLAMECAREGYPTLVAKPLPFSPEAKRVANYLIAANERSDSNYGRSSEAAGRFYETPWLIVFDYLHWQNRESELDRFRQELMKSGRVVCILIVTSTVKPQALYNTSVFKEVATLVHVIDSQEAKALGVHLNRFLGPHGKARAPSAWESFHRNHTIMYAQGMTAFWVSLSFWIQFQYDLSESIQEWVYKKFKATAQSPILRKALLEIAAFSTERVPLIDSLLPRQADSWPVSHLLEDSRSELAAIGLIRITADGNKYWGLIHDLLGRLLINALFYDHETRDALGFSEARDAEHLRFLLLRQVALKPEMGERSNRNLAEEFATTFFKIDPDHGIGSFAIIWRDVLHALENMPRVILDTSRVFRHHVAISRRRIAKLNQNLYQISLEDCHDLLLKAVHDIQYALSSIERKAEDEPDLLLYNSLANAYFDLADIEVRLGASEERVIQLRMLAADATRKAYTENPDNPFTVETFVKNLIQDAKANPRTAAESCIEALGVIFSSLSSDHVVYRRAQLSSLGDIAMTLLLQQSSRDAIEEEPKSELDLLVSAWTLLSNGAPGGMFSDLDGIDSETRSEALKLLANPIGKGNLQVLRLRYDLSCLEYPTAYRQQIELLDQLIGASHGVTAQISLEYAITLFQVGRTKEGDELFKRLRKDWREKELFVFVPERLKWLRDLATGTRRNVTSIIASQTSGRPMARVPGLRNILVPFRPEEYGLSGARPSTSFASTVTFGHNGPFLRPTTSAE